MRAVEDISGYVYGRRMVGVVGCFLEVEESFDVALDVVAGCGVQVRGSSHRQSLGAP